MTIFCVAYTKAGVSGPPRILITNQANAVEAVLYTFRVLQIKLPLDIPKPFSLKQVLALAEDCEISMDVAMIKQEIDCPPPMTKAQIAAAFFASSGRGSVTDRLPDNAINFAERLEEIFRNSLLESIDSKQKGYDTQYPKSDASLSELHKEFLAGTLVSRVKNF